MGLEESASSKSFWRKVPATDEPDVNAGTRKLYLEYNAVDVDVAVKETMLADEDMTENKTEKIGQPPPLPKSTQYV